MFLYEEMDVLRKHGDIDAVPNYLQKNLNKRFELRPYQIEAFENFITYFEGVDCPKPLQVLFHMATGSGKTLIMAGLMLYLYKQGYRNFLFFVNLSNIVEKTKENFLNTASSKYLFDEELVIEGEKIQIKQVDNFQLADDSAINICFTSTQGLHMDLWAPKEGGVSLEDFDDRRTVLISDEAHHLNAETKKKMSPKEVENYHSWEESVRNIFERNPGNILLEFTATCDLENPAIKANYERKIIFNYDLSNFYADKYSKDIVTFRSERNLFERVLQALVLSQYRLKVFQAHGLNIKPVILFKAAKIADSEQFMAYFIETISKLSGTQLSSLAKNIDGNEIMERSFAYFEKREVSFDALAMELRDDFSEEHCISVNGDQDAQERQLALNSLEDADNPYRAVFEVKKLDEGWDVLNLFDIVRLYETRQSGGKKISPATISEAQLIGRGARYCPFQLNDEQPRYQRKYDNDVTNEMRVCETLYYHCQNDHRYVTELKEALKEIGLDVEKTVQRKYELKEEFKTDDVYRYGWVFLNDRVLQDRKEIHELPPNVKNDFYNYTAHTGASGSESLMSDNDVTLENDDESNLKRKRLTIKEIAGINYAIVNKGLMKYPIYKFNTLKSYFPNLKTTREFIMSEEYLGAVNIEIQNLQGEPTPEVLYNAVFFALGKIAKHIASIKETYYGTREFKAKNIREVFMDKTVNYTEPHEEGVGISQNDPAVSDDLRIDLSQEDWFVYNDNYGTSEEKAFIAYFKKHIESFKNAYDKVYLIRNERELHVYSFKDGLRFEPDYLLLLQKNKADGYEQMQIFVEPKGTHLLEKDAWKEEFLLQLKDEAIPTKLFADDNEYKIWGFHFFNHDDRCAEFDADMAEVIDLED